MKRLRAMREPLKYVQGKGALLKFTEEMGYMGHRWLFVCSKSGYKACHEKIEQSFEDAGSDDYRRYEIFGGISSKSEIAKMQAIVEQDGIDTVVAVGGGSAVDTAKATAYYTGKHVVIIPTVAATDAPCTGLSVIYNEPADDLLLVKILVPIAGVILIAGIVVTVVLVKKNKAKKAAADTGSFGEGSDAE